MAQTWRNWQLGLASVLAISGAIATSRDCALAQIRPDNTLGAESSVLKRNVLIDRLPSDRIDGGAKRGANLFHSFREFNTEEGRGAYFTNPSGIKNILSRVTGKNRSNLQGTLGVLGKANLFLINPNGIIFGPNARLDLNGSFVGTTANSIGLANGDSFSADAAEPFPTGLLNVNPNAFFFNQVVAQPITVNSRRVSGTGYPIFLPPYEGFAGLDVANGQSLLLVGGDVSLDGGILNAPGGRVELGGVAGAGTVGLNVDGNNLRLSPDNVARANVLLAKEALVNVAAGGGGDIAINARNLDILEGSILSAGIGEGLGAVGAQAGDITLNATEAIAIEQSSFLPRSIENLVGTNAIGDGGDIDIKAGSLSLTNSAALNTTSFGKGNAGNISVQASGDVSVSDSNITSSTLGDGDAGSISMQAGGNVSFLESDIDAHIIVGEGNTGSILVRAKGSISVSDSSVKTIAQKGDSGSVLIQADDSIRLVNNEISTSTSSGEVGDAAGNITVQANKGNILLGEYNAISSSALFGQGDGGSILVQANKGNIFLEQAAISSNAILLEDYIPRQIPGEGNIGNISVRARGNISSIDSVITSSTSGEKKAGDILVEATGDISFTGVSNIITSATSSQGDAGNISVQADGNISFSDNALTTSYTEGPGKGGNIDIQARLLSITEGARLFAVTFGSGNAGDIKVEADSVTLAGIDQRSGLSSGLFTDTTEEAGAQAGDITVRRTGALRILDGAVLSATTSSDFDGGNITVDVNTLDILGGGQILTTAFSSGNAGRIIANAANSIILSGSDPTFEDRSDEPFDQGAFSPASSFSGLFSNTNSGSTGNGGTIEVNTTNLSLSSGAGMGIDSSGRGSAGNFLRVNARNKVAIDNGFISSRLGSAAVGQGGAISLKVGSLSLANGAQLEASTAGRGNAGSISVQADDSVSLTNGSQISSAVESKAVGKGNEININARSLSLVDGAQLRASTAGAGSSGNIDLNVTESVNLSGISESGFSSGLLTNTEPGAGGQGGDIAVTTNALNISDGAVLSAQTRNAFRGGNIAVNTNTLEATDGGQILTTAFSRGNAGNITINATDSVTLSSSDPSFPNRLAQLGPERVDPDGPASGLFARATGTANAGGLTVNTKQLAVEEGAEVSTTTTSGKGGDIKLEGLNSLKVSNGGQVSASTETGRAGSLNVNANENAVESVQLSGQDSGLRAQATDGGSAGSLTINARQLSVEDRAEVNVSSPLGQAGNLEVTANSIVLDRGKLTAVAGAGDGGNIELGVPNLSLDLLLMRNSSEISAEALSAANGGNVDVSTNFLVAIPSENSDIVANAIRGNGGKIGITTQGIFGIEPRPEQTPKSDITASSELGINGVVEINTPDVDPRQGVVALPEEVIDASGLVVQRCPAGGGSVASRTSRFVVTGRGGLPPDPSEPSSSEAVLADWITLDPKLKETGSNPAPTNYQTSEAAPITEAQGWMRDSKGQVILTAQASTGTSHSSGLTPASCSVGRTGSQDSYPAESNQKSLH